MTFAGVTLVSVLATVGLVRGLPQSIGAHLPVASLLERIHAPPTAAFCTGC